MSLCFSCLLHADTFKDVEYVHQGANGKGEKEGGSLVVDSEFKQILFSGHNATELVVPFSQVTHLVYEKTSKPRYVAGPLLFAKTKQHFLTLEYKDGDTGKYAVFHLSKKDYREILAAAEAATGQKAERQEE